MIEFAPFRPKHLAELQLQNAQAYMQPLLEEDGYGELIAIPGLAWSGLIEGQMVGCAGILPLTDRRAQAWALIGAIPRDQWIRVHRRVQHALAAAHREGLWRIETAVDAAFSEGIRWAEALGFVNETPNGMTGYSPEGRDCLLFARIDERRLAAARTAEGR